MVEQKDVTNAQTVGEQNGIKNDIQNIKIPEVKTIEMVKESIADPPKLVFAFDEDSEDLE